MGINDRCHIFHGLSFGPVGIQQGTTLCDVVRLLQGDWWQPRRLVAASSYGPKCHGYDVKNAPALNWAGVPRYQFAGL